MNKIRYAFLQWLYNRFFNWRPITPKSPPPLRSVFATDGVRVGTAYRPYNGKDLVWMDGAKNRPPIWWMPMPRMGRKDWR